MAMQAGDIISRLMLDMSDFRKAMKSAPGIARKDLDKINKGMKTTMRQMDKSVKSFVDKSEKHGKKFEKGWWARFGAVALGFTIAYRAMNAFERGLQKLSETMLEAIRESGELASLQAKLALWTTMHSKGVIEYADAFRYARGTMLALMEASVTSLSSINELSTGLDEMGQTLGLVRTETVKAAVDLIDFTVLVAQTTGSVTRQVRQEIQSLLQGQLRTTNIVIRTMRIMGVITDEDIAKLKAQIDVQETFDKILVAVSEHMEVFREQVLRTDVNKAFAYWEKSIRVVLVRSVLLASVLENVGNIFAEELVPRAREFGKALSEEDIARSIIMMQRLRDVFALGLDIFERIVISAGYVATAMTNLSDEILYVVRGLALLLGVGVVTKAFELFGKTAIWLYATPIELLKSAFASLYVRILAIPVAILLTMVAFKTLEKQFLRTEDSIEDIQKRIDPLAHVIDFIARRWKIDAEAVRKVLLPLLDAIPREGIITDLIKAGGEKAAKVYKELAEKSKKIAKGTLEDHLDFWELYLKDLGTAGEAVLTVLAPLMKKLKEEFKEAVTPDIDIKALMEQYKQLMKGVGLEVPDRVKALTKEVDEYAKKLDKLIAKYRITYTLLAMIRRDELKPEDVALKRKQLEIESDRLILLRKNIPGLSELAVKYAEIALANLKANEQIKEAIDLEKELQTEAKKRVELYWKGIQAQMQAEYDLGKAVEEGVAESTASVKAATLEQLTAMRDMYEDMRSYGQDYFDVTNALIDLQADEYEKLLGDEINVTAWAFAEKEKIARAYWESHRQLELQAADSMVDNWTYVFQQLGQKSKGAFETFKRMQQLQAVIDAIRASLAAYKWGWEYGGPAAPYVSAAMMASAWIVAYAKVAMIEAQQYQGYAVGGWLDTHPGGGKIGEGAGRKDDVFLGATPGVRHWGMRDEFVFVMNKEDTKKFEAMREAMNQGWASGGWIDKGYGMFDFDLGSDFSMSDIDLGVISNVFEDIGGWTGDVVGLDPIVSWLIKIYEELSKPLPKIPWDEKVFESILYNIDQMLGKTTALDDMLRSTGQQFDDWIKQLTDMGATAAQLAAVEDQRQDVLAYLTAQMKDEVWTDIGKQIADLVGVFTPLQQQVISISDAFDQMVEDLEGVEMAYDEVGNATAELIAVENARIAAIHQLVQIQQEALQEELTGRLARLRLDPDRLTQWNLMQEFMETMEQIYEQAEVTGEDYSDLINRVTAVYEEEMNAAILQSEAAQELQNAADEWQKVADSLADAIWEMQTTLTSPADVLERMALVWSEIVDLEAIGATTPEEVQKLQELYAQYLGLAQEAYQRPSSEYQAIYSTIIGALETLKGIAEGQPTYEDQIITLLTDQAADLSSIATNIMAGIPVSMTLGVDDFTIAIDPLTVTATVGTVIVNTILDPSTLSFDASLINIPAMPDFTQWFGDAGTMTAIEAAINANVIATNTVLGEIKTVMEQIRANTYAIGGSVAQGAAWGHGFVGHIRMPPYAKYGGTFVGPESGYPVMLHGIERVTPLGGAGGDASFVMNLSINESKSPHETGRVVTDAVKTFLKSGQGRMIIQDTSKGR